MVGIKTRGQNVLLWICKGQMEDVRFRLGIEGYLRFAARRKEYRWSLCSCYAPYFSLHHLNRWMVWSHSSSPILTHVYEFLIQILLTLINDLLMKSFSDAKHSLDQMPLNSFPSLIKFYTTHLHLFQEFFLFSVLFLAFIFRIIFVRLYSSRVCATYF